MVKLEIWTTQNIQSKGKSTEVQYVEELQGRI